MLKLVGYIVAFIIVGAIVLSIISDWGIEPPKLGGGGNTTWVGYNSTSWSVEFFNFTVDDVYNAGVNKTFDIHVNNHTLLQEGGNYTFKEAIIKLLGTSPRYMSPSQYSVVAGLAGFLDLKKISGDPDSVAVGSKVITGSKDEFIYSFSPIPLDAKDAENYTTKTLVVKMPRLDVSKLNITYPPSADATVYNLTYLADYVFVYGWAEYTYSDEGTSVVVQLQPYLQIYRPNGSERQNLPPITVVFDLSGESNGRYTRTYTKEFGYYRGVGPLGYVHLEATRDCVKSGDSYSCIRYLSKVDFRYRMILFEEMAFEKYLWLQIYHGSTPDRSAPIYVVVEKVENGLVNITKIPVMNYFSFPYWKRWGLAVVGDRVWSHDTKDVHYKVSVCDNISVAGEVVDRCYDVLEYNASYIANGNLPPWNEYGVMEVREVVKDWKLYRAPDWSKADFEFVPDVDAGRRYLLYTMLNLTVEDVSEFVNRTITKNNSMYSDYEKFMLIAQVPSAVVTDERSNDSVLYTFEFKRGNYSAVAELGALASSLIVRVNYTTTSGWYYRDVFDVNVTEYNTTLTLTLLGEMPSNTLFVQNVTTDCGKVAVSEFGYQGLSASWVWLRNGTYEAVFSNMPNVGDFVVFSRGWNSGWGIEWVKRDKILCKVLEYKMLAPLH